jgi:hypothetical protein
MMEWSNSLTGLLREQIDQLSTANIRATQGNASVTNLRRSIYAEPPKWTSVETRKAFIAKWNYSVELAKWHYAEGLLDQRGFLKWSLDQLQAANFDQTNLMIPLVSSMIHDYSRSRTLMRYFFDIVFNRLNKVYTWLITP